MQELLYHTLGGDMVLGWKTKRSNLWGQMDRNLRLSPLIFRLVLIKCFQCLKKLKRNRVLGNVPLKCVTLEL